MNSSYKTYGIVIKRSNYGEADRILTIFTERFGKIKAIAKGVRKTKSKLAGSLEPFILSELQLHQGKTFFTVTGASIREEMDNLRQNLVMISKAFYLSELLDKFTQDHQAQEEVFNLYSQSLRSINEDHSGLVIEEFELKLLEAAGFRPQLFECVHCREKLVAGENYWDAVGGGVVCGNCQRANHSGTRISDNAIKILRLAEEGKSSGVRLKVDQGLIAEIEKILNLYIKNILEKEVKSEKFMREIIRS